MRLGKKFHICSEFPIHAIHGQTFLIAPMDHSVKSWNNLFGLCKPISSMYFFDRFPSKLSLTTNHLLRNFALKWYKTVQLASSLVVFRWFCYPGM